ncbi:nucleoside-diphosphate-sugar epimerase [Kibdelosporangium banguiense]|uniref:Nucleoside-diphosphate-sugar epimerase n=1 Tax=Kibdelosporangium banguiense TaxID=1365924 RepID=A0ABS4THN9_9PSEU|nr:NAD-dependent epimerase/dehydratase family protein [Kibdelosporangium banguiense]MBP2323336.1 nucleoside-diphosphate-sugar epimerase [Kibdelosporangium banguiense]
MPHVLILGGSWFLGRATAELAVAKGWDVTIFRRGRSESGPDPAGVRTIHGDYADARSASDLAARGPYDLVVDNLAFTPRDTLAMAHALSSVAQKYVVISSVSAYKGWPTEPLTEDSFTLDCEPDAGPDPGYDADPGPSTYGFGKAGCERAVLRVFGAAGSVVLRPGVILGPGEYVGRTAWWLARMRKGGDVVAPHPADRSIQPVDVRDVAAFALTAPTGVFNVTATGMDTFGDFLDACQREAPAPTGTALHWVPPETLLAHDVHQWTELPLWRTYAGAWDVDSSRARAAGLVTRPIAETVRDTAAWLADGGALVTSERAAELGLSPEKEAEILADHRRRTHGSDAR